MSASAGPRLSVISELEETLFANDRPINAPVDDATGARLLHQACADNRADIVRLVGKHGGDAEIRDRSGDTGLHYCARVDAVEAASALLALGARPGVVNARGDTPLHLAASAGSTGCLRLLLLHGADSGAVDADGDTAMHRACLAGSLAAVNCLARHDLSLVNAEGCAGERPLHVAAMRADAKLFSLLLDLRAELGARDRRGSTALDAAANALPRLNCSGPLILILARHLCHDAEQLPTVLTRHKSGTRCDDDVANLLDDRQSDWASQFHASLRLIRFGEDPTPPALTPAIVSNSFPPSLATTSETLRRLLFGRRPDPIALARQLESASPSLVRTLIRCLQTLDNLAELVATHGLLRGHDRLVEAVASSPPLWQRVRQRLDIEDMLRCLYEHGNDPASSCSKDAQALYIAAMSCGLGELLRCRLSRLTLWAALSGRRGLAFRLLRREHLDALPASALTVCLIRGRRQNQGLSGYGSDYSSEADAEVCESWTLELISAVACLAGSDAFLRCPWPALGGLSLLDILATPGAFRLRLLPAIRSAAEADWNGNINLEFLEDDRKDSDDSLADEEAHGDKGKQTATLRVDVESSEIHNEESTAAALGKKSSRKINAVKCFALKNLMTSVKIAVSSPRAVYLSRCCFQLIYALFLTLLCTKKFASYALLWCYCVAFIIGSAFEELIRLFSWPTKSSSTQQLTQLSLADRIRYVKNCSMHLNDHGRLAQFICPLLGFSALLSQQFLPFSGASLALVATTLTVTWLSLAQSCCLATSYLGPAMQRIEDTVLGGCLWPAAVIIALLTTPALRMFTSVGTEDLRTTINSITNGSKTDWHLLIRLLPSQPAAIEAVFLCGLMAFGLAMALLTSLLLTIGGSRRGAELAFGSPIFDAWLLRRYRASRRSWSGTLKYKCLPPPPLNLLAGLWLLASSCLIRLLSSQGTWQTRRRHPSSSVTSSYLEFGWRSVWLRCLCCQSYAMRRLTHHQPSVQQHHSSRFSGEHPVSTDTYQQQQQQQQQHLSNQIRRLADRQLDTQEQLARLLDRQESFLSQRRLSSRPHTRSIEDIDSEADAIVT